jgi:hypothetical protein
VNSLGIKLFLFQNDEHELLADWLQYHAYVFGISNLVVIDHKSRSNQICSLLALYEQCGAKVIPYSGDFEKKHTKLSETMRKYTKSWLVPLDTDEFVVLQERNSTGYNTGLAYDRERIVRAIKSLPIDGRKYKFAGSCGLRYDGYVCNSTLHPHDQGQPAFRRALQHGYTRLTARNPHDPRGKTFFYSDGFLSTDQGNHFGEVKHDEGKVNMVPEVKGNLSHYFLFTDLALLHLTTPSYQGAKRKILRGADAYGFTDRTNCTTVIVGKGYCAPAKLYRHDSPEMQASYMATCQRRDADSYSTRPFSEWFRRYSLSMEDLVGDEYPRLQHHSTWWQSWF